MYNITEVAYLPDIKTSLLDDCDLSELNRAYDFCCEKKTRAFCTYLDLIPCIQHDHYPVRLVPVIDFPRGYSNREEKIFEAGRAYELCKKASASEIDVVLGNHAVLDIEAFNSSMLWNRIGIKYILEIGCIHRDIDDIRYIVQTLNEHKDKFKYIKTNTGKNAFDEKKRIELLKFVRTLTDAPIKISGGITSFEMMKTYKKLLGKDTIFGVSYSKIKDWK